MLPDNLMEMAVVEDEVEVLTAFLKIVNKCPIWGFLHENTQIGSFTCKMLACWLAFYLRMTVERLTTVARADNDWLVHVLAQGLKELLTEILEISDGSAMLTNRRV